MIRNVAPSPEILAAVARHQTDFVLTAPPERLTGGNLNHVWRLLSGERSLILKHAPPFVATHPEIPLSPARLLFEARALALFARGGKFHSLATDALRPPRLLAHDSERHFLLLEDVGPGPDLAALLPPPDTGQTLGTLISQLHRDSVRDPELARTFDNGVVQQARFGIQYRAVARLAQAAGVDSASAARIDAHATSLGRFLLGPGRCLVMGDLWPRSLLTDGSRLRLIDWECAHFGQPLQDLAHFGAHCWMQAQTAASAEAAQRWLECWETFVTAYRTENPRFLSPADEAFMNFHAGAEILMRSVGPFVAGYCYEDCPPNRPSVSAAVGEAVRLLDPESPGNKPATSPSNTDMTVSRWTALCFTTLVAWTSSAPAFDQTHAGLSRLLKENVRDALVNYPALKATPRPLDDYLTQLAAVSQAEFDGWNKNDRLAFLINLYNATTLKLIVENYPVKSIRSIGWLPGAAWKKEVVGFFGKKISLDELEHGIIRKTYAEPRAHFALVCAALGCPPLREEAYVGARLDEQLDDQGRRFLGTVAKNRVDPAAHVVYLSPIFKWFAEDFEGAAGTVLKFVTPFFPEPTRAALAGSGEFKIEYTDYDWSLNDQAKK